MPIAHFEGCKKPIVVSVANACVNTHTRGELTATADFNSSRAIERCVHHAPGEVESAVIEITPEVPYVLASEVTQFVVEDRGSTVRVGSCPGAWKCAVAVRGIHGSGEERLRCDAVEVTAVSGISRSIEVFRRRNVGAASVGRNGASQGHGDVSISILELLATLRHHVWHGVEVDRLILVLYPPSDVAQLECHSFMQLSLNR